ncbi:MAG: Fic family protein [Saccharofermentanales bacterium]
MSFYKLSKDDIIFIHAEYIKMFGGLDGIRDETLLESAIESPYQTFDGMMLYEDPIERIARLGFNIIKNHPFIDGNKRTGMATMLALLRLE